MGLGFNALPRVLFGTATYALIRAARAGYRITELPVEVAARKHGPTRGVNARVMARSLLDVARVWRALRAEKR